METLPVRSTAGSWSQTGGFMRADCISTSWLWNLHADAHDFRGHTSDLDNLSRRVFASHFGHLSLIFTWLSGMYFSGARFSNYESWLQDPTHGLGRAESGCTERRAGVGGWRVCGHSHHLGFLQSVAWGWNSVRSAAFQHGHRQFGIWVNNGGRRLVPLPQICPNGDLVQ